jgi:hypothetical protein
MCFTNTVFFIRNMCFHRLFYCKFTYLFQDEVNQRVNIWFIFQKTKYVWDANKKQFCGLQFPVDLSFGDYMEWKGYQEDHEVTYADVKYGRNQYVLFVFNGFNFVLLPLQSKMRYQLHSTNTFLLECLHLL